MAAQQKTPLRGGGALLGLLQGGEICISIYVDPWEVGEPSGVVGARCGKHLGPYVRRGTRPKSFVFRFLSVAPTESLTSVRTYVRNVCERGHTEWVFPLLPCGNPPGEPNSVEPLVYQGLNLSRMTALKTRKHRDRPAWL